MRLTLNELLDLGSMQTDPNWANFLYNSRTRQVTIFYMMASEYFACALFQTYAGCSLLLYSK